MRKIGTILLCLCLCLPLFGCEEVTKKPEGDIAYISYFANSVDENYHQAVVNALEAYTTENDTAYTEYQLRDTTLSSFTKTLDLAIKIGATTFIVPYDFYQALMEVHTQYANIKFLLLDTTLDEELLGDVKNIYTVNFNSYEMGYVVGYLVALENYSSIGYASSISNAIQDRYISGIVQGLNDGAKSLEKQLTFTIYNYQGKTEEDKQAGIALAYQSEIDVFFYLGSDLYMIIDEYTERSNFKFVSYSVDDCDPENDLMQISLDYKALFLSAIRYVHNHNVKTNLIYGFKDGVQTLKYDMKYLKKATERAYMKLEDCLQDGSLVLEYEDSKAWNQTKLSNVTIVEK